MRRYAHASFKRKEQAVHAIFLQRRVYHLRIMHAIHQQIRNHHVFHNRIIETHVANSHQGFGILHRKPACQRQRENQIFRGIIRPFQNAFFRLFAYIRYVQRLLRRNRILRADPRKHLFKRIFRTVTSQLFEKSQRTERKRKRIIAHSLFQLFQKRRFVLLQTQPHCFGRQRIRIIGAVLAPLRRLHFRHHVAFQNAHSVVICVFLAKIIVKIGNESVFFHVILSLAPPLFLRTPQKTGHAPRDRGNCAQNRRQPPRKFRATLHLKHYNIFRAKIQPFKGLPLRIFLFPARFPPANQNLNRI